jgi:uncharacterized protein GlcG (DUF336 family)
MFAASCSNFPTQNSGLTRSEFGLVDKTSEDWIQADRGGKPLQAVFLAREIGQPMNIAVADEGGNIVAHVRMDNAWIVSIDISMKKAYTSRAFDIETIDLAKHSQSGGQFFGIHASNDGKIMIFAGGIPLKHEGKVVGAIRVSGGSGDQDHAVATAGAAAF